MKPLKLGIIGISEGNGHPYSWAAIFNGYNPGYMKNCQFPVITKYLEKQKFPQDSIKNAKVSHIWTQNKTLSKQIAKASNIKNIVNHYKDLIGQVDAILLARDDYQNHYKMSKPFIEAGLPIYIDKPLEINIKTAKKIFSLEQYKNQIFTCSALSYAKELQLTETNKKKLGKIKYIDACISKDWEKYGIHIVEPVLNIIEKNKIISKKTKIKQINSQSFGNKKLVNVNWNNDLTTSFLTLGTLKAPIKIRLFGTREHIELIFQDTFNAFKNALQTFINIINNKEKAPSKKFILKTIKIIEQGCKNE